VYPVNNPEQATCGKSFCRSSFSFNFNRNSRRQPDAKEGVALEDAKFTLAK
jgi:hypothetical protein